MFAQDSETDLGEGFYDSVVVEKPNEQLRWSAWKVSFPWPLKPRQFLIRNEFSQDPQTRQLVYKVTGSPEKLPPDSCCYRVAIMKNTWLLTPVGNGELDVEWDVDMDAGLPYFIANPMAAVGMYDFAPKLQRLVDREIYKDAKYQWIQEGQPQPLQHAGVSSENAAVKN